MGQFFLCFNKHHTEEIQVSIGKDIIQPADGHDYNIHMRYFMSVQMLQSYLTGQKKCSKMWVKLFKLQWNNTINYSYGDTCACAI